MNAAKTHIMENQNMIRELQNESSQAEHSENLHSLEMQMNSSMASREQRIRTINSRILELESQLDSVKLTLQTLSNQLNSTFASRPDANETKNQEVRSIPNEWSSELQKDTQKNNMLIGSNKRAIQSLQHKLLSRNQINF